MTAPEVITLGESMVVLTPVAPGLLRYAHTYQRSMAGAETNVAIGLTRLGHGCGVITRLGADEFGQYILTTLRGEGVDVSGVRLEADAPTGLYIKERPATGDPRVFYYRKGSAASRLTPGDLPAPRLQGAKLLHVTGITPALSESARATVAEAVAIAREAGVPVSFDPNFRRKLWTEEEARPVLWELAAHAQVVLPGIEESRLLTGASDPEVGAKQILALGPEVVVVKLGPEGALVADASGTRHVAGFPLEPVDTVGAGDAFAAAFLAGYLEGRTAEESARRACAAGALATQVVGDWEGLPDREQLDAFLQGRAGITR